MRSFPTVERCVARLVEKIRGYGFNEHLIYFFGFLIDCLRGRWRSGSFDLCGELLLHCWDLSGWRHLGLCGDIERWRDRALGLISI